MDKNVEMLHKLCKAITEELDDYSKKIEKSDGMSAGDLEAVDKLSHALKSIKTTIAMMEADDEEGGYSERYMPWYGGMSYADGRGGNRGGNRGGSSSRGGSSYEGGNSYEGGSSYARGRGGNAKRDSMGRYSREGGYSYAEDVEATLDEIREMTQKLPEEHRNRIERAIDMR